jgi:uncharacterized protein (TIGR02453 family)
MAVAPSATVAAPATFTGFTPDAIQFLADLAANNDRAWFQPRKADYERLLKDPMASFIAALAERFAARGIPLVADPVRSPFRIYRDTRFSRDKSPYKTHLGASFPWAAAVAAGEGPHGVGGYFNLQPGEIYVGGGMWHPEKARLDAFRRAVVDDPASVRAVIGDPAFAAAFGSVNGDRLTRVPRGYPPDHPEAELLRLKDVVFGRRLSDDEAFSADLPDTVADALGASVPVLRLLAGLVALGPAPLD